MLWANFRLDAFQWSWVRQPSSRWFSDGLGWAANLLQWFSDGLLFFGFANIKLSCPPFMVKCLCGQKPFLHFTCIPFSLLPVNCKLLKCTSRYDCDILLKYESRGQGGGQMKLTHFHKEKHRAFQIRQIKITIVAVMMMMMMMMKVTSNLSL